MPQVMSAEQILREIYQSRPEVFEDGARLVAFFSDYSRGKLRPQQNQLEIFLKCDGNTRILKVRSASRVAQQTEYARLVRTIVDDYGIQDAAVQKMCGAFWRVVTGTEPPVAEASPRDAAVTPPAPPTPPTPSTPSVPPAPPVPPAADTAPEPAAADAAAEALYQQGMEYWYGRGAAAGMPREQRVPRAVQWLEKAAALNHLEAQKQLDLAYNSRWWSGYDPAKSVYWCRRAAEQGDPEAQMSMAQHYRNGDNDAQDYNEAIRWYQKAAAQNSTNAMLSLGLLYGYRLNTPTLGFEWCRRAAELGNREAQWRLGQMYEQGIGVAKNPAQATYWYKKADIPIAYKELARCYREGIGVPKDAAQAEYWQRKA